VELWGGRSNRTKRAQARISSASGLRGWEGSTSSLTRTYGDGIRTARFLFQKMVKTGGTAFHAALNFHNRRKLVVSPNRKTGALPSCSGIRGA
jgi:hypothetical protein